MQSNPNKKQPALFLGHGSPMNMLRPELDINQNITRIAQTFAKPKAIVCVSAHWYDGLWITGAAQPDTIYDFYGFPEALYQQNYPAAGSPELAQQLCDLLPEAQIHPTRGLDHGAWAVLKFLSPQADVPVVQLGLDLSQPPQWHYEQAQRLRVLREQGVLIVGSGNIVHNLRAAQRTDHAPAYDWAEQFLAHINHAIEYRQHDNIINYHQFGDVARLSVPTPEHLLPLLYVLAQQDDSDRVALFNNQMDMGSISMTSVLLH
ncbi:4,5-DOPA dioxygenase extradiol [Kingella kingae]|uniref:Extradiol-type ring-opening dioxygenase n=2 Tax=Kingella kingae TaxID=504 RepID=F5S8F6_KINKI|nr:4,5-DOPA dioxygenase extradiol [Kingella kingae]EGK08197.1 extradiol-type ring-opening dioxygenase [Kingella kingae ATCC 23330]MDK4533625.1 4,5-DOPA dioxygenase extradiol [Kingella kingae]MDK4540134.1 4,5-DOPA dioxygenase extradiol [Kingella kingae]MDK4552663.1 4,5-DOPA dioxygenase extradiol [Kingella kingae]UOP02588.1 4,5-DOPA dioxygenase extradiol [Kingella kingae]